MLYDKRWDVKQADETLLGAVDYINKHGWCQRAFIKEDGRACALGAMNQASTGHGGYENYRRAYTKLEKYLKTSSIASWNDEKGQTKERVVAALVGAAYLI